MRSMALLAASALVLPACSFVFVRGPRTGRETYGQVRCTTSRAAPIIDTAIAGLQLVRVGYAASLTSDDYRGTTLSREADIGIGAGLLLLAGVSAAYGFGTVAECRDLGGGASPYTRPQERRTREERLADEAAEEAAVGARQRQNAAADAKAAGEAAGRAPVGRPAAPVAPP